MSLAAKDRSFVCDHLGLAALSLASGCTDVLTFLKLGSLFTSAMTGNTGLLAIAIGNGQALAASRNATALIGFTVGVVLATAMSAASRALPEPRRRLRRLLRLELVFLVAGAALWSVNPAPLGAALYAIIVFSSLSMGMQAVAAGATNMSGVNTIVFTSALVRMVSTATSAALRRIDEAAAMTRAAPHLATFVAYGTGCLLAAVFVSRQIELMIWAPVVAVVAAFGLSRLADALDEAA